MNYFLKKKLHSFKKTKISEAANNYTLFPMKTANLITSFLYKNNILNFLTPLKKLNNKRLYTLDFKTKQNTYLKNLCTGSRLSLTRYELLYIFLRQISKIKKHKAFSSYSKLITTLKIMTLTSVTSFSKKSLSGYSVSQNLVLYQTLNDYFFSPSFYFNINKGSRWLSMEEIINHFLFYSEGPCLPQGFSQGSVEAPKGHLGVSIISNGSNKPVRARIRSSILVMAGHVNSLVQGVGLGDFVVIVSASNIVVGEIDR